MSAAAKAKVLSDEHKANIGKSHLGSKRSVETRQKMGAWQVGRKLSDETKEKIRAQHVGRRHSQESKEKMSAARAGKKMSPEATQARIDSRMRNYAVKLGVDPDAYVSAGDKARSVLKARYRRGKRGEDLTRGVL
jgi:uncharacterized membrane-anchored protein